MIREIYLYENKSWDREFDISLDSENSLVICFGCTDSSKIEEALSDVNNNFSKSIII